MPKTIIDILDRSAALKDGRCGFCGEKLTVKTHKDAIDVGDVTGQLAYKEYPDVPFCEACQTFWYPNAQDALHAEAERVRDAIRKGG